MAQRNEIPEGKELVDVLKEGEKRYVFGVESRNWLRKAIETQRAALVRSRTKELAGSEIYQLRTREIDALNSLYNSL